MRIDHRLNFLFYIQPIKSKPKVENAPMFFWKYETIFVLNAEFWLISLMEVGEGAAGKQQ